MKPRLAPRTLVFRRLERRLRRVLLTPVRPWLRRDPPRVVRVPPLDQAFVDAIKLIAPQYTSLTCNEDSRQFWELDQNNSCWTEEAALGSLLTAMPRPGRILEIGPGFGRSAIFVGLRHFPEAQFDLFDAAGKQTKYELLGHRYADSFCGDLGLLRRCLDFNQVSRCRILDAALTNGRIPMPEAPYDFVYSFYAVGFHWDLDHWLDELLAVGGPATLYAFLVPSHYEPSARVAALPHLLLQAHSPLYPERTVYFLTFTPHAQPWLPGCTIRQV